MTRRYGDLSAFLLLALGAALLVLEGCASSPVTITFTPGIPGEGGTFAGGEAARPQLSTVSIEPSAYGRQCFDAEISPDGSVAVTFAVDGTSDWAGVRAAYAAAPEIVAAVMAIVSAPFDLLSGILGIERKEMAEPSAFSACSAIFED